MKAKMLTLTLMCGLMMWAPVGAWAECNAVERELDRTWDILQGERERLSDCSVPHVRGLVDQAVKQLRDSRRESQANRCNRAEMHLNAAQNLITKARDLCQDEDKHRDRVVDFLNQTDQMLFRAVGETADNAPQECAGLLRMAREQQTKAWRQFRAEQPRFALSLSGSARRTLESALRCRHGGARQDEVVRELERTDMMLERTQDAANFDQRLWDAAVQLQGKAWNQYEDRRYNISLRLTHQARVLAARSITDSGGSHPREVELLIRSVDELLAELESLAEESDDPASETLLRRAHELLDQARQSLADGDPRTAMVRAQQAAKLAVQAGDRLQDEGR